MVKVFINGRAIFVPKNSSVLEACEKIGQLIPRFCFHEKLNVAGNCRMCLVEIEKSPKPIASCAFPVSSNMKIFTESPLVQKARENVLEFLLLNHPLDCPICDQGGECDLQEQTLAFGADRNRFRFLKRGVEDKNCGPLVKTIMTRCIHCTRCVRFFQDVAGSDEFGTTLRGRETEIGSYIKKNLNSELSGNVIDLCPVGALTSKPYAFLARPWEVKSIETVDILDSVGSSIKINFKETEILRVLPLPVDDLNEEWISDKTRFFFDSLKTQRIGHCFLKKDGCFQKISWKNVLDQDVSKMVGLSQLNVEEGLFVCGNNLDFKTIHDLKRLALSYRIDLITENYNEISPTLISNFKLNMTFDNLLSSDTCLTFGSNIRFEASMLNVRLKKRFNMGGFSKASIGLCENFTYLNDSLGNSYRTFVDIAEGRHYFCKILAKSKAPSLMLGGTLNKRFDLSANNLLLSYICKNTNVVRKDWFGLGFLSTTSSSFAEKFLGINSCNNIALTNKKFVYCVGVEFYENIFSKLEKTDNFILVQTPFSDPLLKKTNLILPSTLPLEKESLFLNIEGRLQKTNIGLFGPSLARDDSNILTELWPARYPSLLEIPVYSVRDLDMMDTLICENHMYKAGDEFSLSDTYISRLPNAFTIFSYSVNTEEKSKKESLKIFENSAKHFLKIEENKNTFTKQLFLNEKKYHRRIRKTPLRPLIPNFFSSSVLTKLSITLAKCSSLLAKNYSNFI